MRGVSMNIAKAIQGDNNLKCHLGAIEQEPHLGIINLDLYLGGLRAAPYLMYLEHKS